VKSILCIDRSQIFKYFSIDSMDHTTEQRLQEVLQHDLAGCTCIAVAHRIGVYYGTTSITVD
jgi:ABC-type bacteriocin/lantibiotic exporter with double-glycine peptidase domain